MAEITVAELEAIAQYELPCRVNDTVGATLMLATTRRNLAKAQRELGEAERAVAKAEELGEKIPEGIRNSVKQRCNQKRLALDKAEKDHEDAVTTFIKRSGAALNLLLTELEESGWEPEQKSLLAALLGEE